MPAILNMPTPAFTVSRIMSEVSAENYDCLPQFKALHDVPTADLMALLPSFFQQHPELEKCWRTSDGGMIFVSPGNAILRAMTAEDRATVFYVITYGEWVDEPECSVID